ncbi:hypothetical protein TNIN_315951 [Trichonephila inaurata madagascariensis]|uniref:Uncharacterized protein n=1 Tax=Trichonephila inaurata madagascariensis TaxID=2747483 RepID=A0A8X7C8S5_9ARAC|nr:hypothetical protein TNIN_315951 [Trichonephila inaurata madagascariensis]
MGRRSFTLFVEGGAQLGVEYYELLELNETISRDNYKLKLMYRRQELRVKWAVYEKRHDNLILRQNNVSARQKLPENILNILRRLDLKG